MPMQEELAPYNIWWLESCAPTSRYIHVLFDSQINHSSGTPISVFCPWVLFMATHLALRFLDCDVMTVFIHVDAPLLCSYFHYFLTYAIQASTLCL